VTGASGGIAVAVRVMVFISRIAAPILIIMATIRTVLTSAISMIISAIRCKNAA
jgi:hypothetical protein